MKIAIIGSGISGLLSARLLAADHDIHVFEANNYAGGHTNTVSFEAFGRQYAADTGFMVFNDRTYPNFVRMLQMLDVPARNSDMSFSVRCDKTGLEYQGSSLNGLFAQRRNLVRPSFYRMLLDVLRFNRQSLELLQAEDYELELGQYLDRNRYSREFIDHYLIPMGAAIWSAPPDRFRQFPARFIVNFFNNHGLLTVRGHPQWKTVQGGAVRYVEAITRPFANRIRLNCPVVSVRRYPDRVAVTWKHGGPEDFDAVVLAAHSDQSLAMLADASQAEREILGAFAYQTERDGLARRSVAAAPLPSCLGLVELSDSPGRRPAGGADVQPQSTSGTRLARPDLRHLERHALDRREEDPSADRVPSPGLQPRSPRGTEAVSRDQRPEPHVLLRRVLGTRLSRGRRQQRIGRRPMLRQTVGIMHSCLYQGYVQHRRLSPAEHVFRYGLYLAVLGP